MSYHRSTTCLIQSDHFFVLSPYVESQGIYVSFQCYERACIVHVVFGRTIIGLHHGIYCNDASQGLTIFQAFEVEVL